MAIFSCQTRALKLCFKDIFTHFGYCQTGRSVELFSEGIPA
jgi:hypothetical protein